MSIIYEALKKVEKSQNPPQAPQTETPPAPPKKSLAQQVKTGLILILVLASGIFVANLLFNLLHQLALRSHDTKVTVQPQKTPPPVIPHPAKTEEVKKLPEEITSSAPEPAPLENVQGSILATRKNEQKSESAPKLVLNGIFSSNGQSYALINNHILKEGDSINGAIIKRISPAGVDIESADGNRHLSHN